MRGQLVIKRWLFIFLLAIVSMVSAQAAQAEVTPWTDKDLPSWQGPTRQMLLEFVFAVSTPGHKDFIPRHERIAVFDVDGTMMTERPLIFVMEVALAHMAKECGKLRQRSPAMAELCDAAAKHDYKALYGRIGQILSLPLYGMTHTEYRALALKVFETTINPVKKIPQRRMVYRPQVELVDLLHRRGFTVYLNSGSDVFALMAISRKYLHVPPERCIGTTFTVRLVVENGRLRCYRTGLEGGNLNLRENKVSNLMNRTGMPPVLAFGNSSGDEWMLRFAAAGPRRHLSLVLDHDDPREFVYRKPKLLATAQKEGWQVVSMRSAFKVIY